MILSCLLLSTSSFLTLVCLVSSSSFRLRVQIIQSYSGALYEVASCLLIQEEEKERREEEGEEGGTDREMGK